jgi:ABC-type antimicrobial peptide transport system permease subunit
MFSGDDTKRQVNRYMYSSQDVGTANVILFNGEQYVKNSLREDQVIISLANLISVFNSEKNALSGEDRTLADGIIRDLANNDSLTYRDKANKVADLAELLGIKDKEKTARLIKTDKDTKETQSKDVVVVGVYVDLYETRPVSTYTYRVMISPALMEYFNIALDQGDYSRILLSPKSNLFGSRKLSNYMVEEEGFSLVWYGNTALNTIRQNEDVIRQGADLFLYIALVLAAFSVFMLFNYIATSIVNKRQSIGVLRGLGAGSKDILRMFLIESILIALINAVIAIGVGALGCIFVNMYIANVMNINIPFALFGVRQVALILGLSIGTAIISSAAPILKISKEKPVDLIRKP